MDRRRRYTAFRTAWILMLWLVLMLSWLPETGLLDPYEQDLESSLLPPGPVHWFGTDELGRDLLARVICGTKYSLSIAFLAVGGAAVVGGIMGLAGGFFGGWVDAVISQMVDLMLAFPGFLLALAAAAVMGPGYWNVAAAVGLFSVPTFARVLRSRVLQVKGRVYVQSAVAVGAGTCRLLLVHVLPNSIGPLLVVATNRLGGAILAAGGLSFLGLGVQPPLPEWGAMLAAGRQYLWVAPHLVIVPGLTIGLTALVFNLLGELGEYGLGRAE